MEYNNNLDLIKARYDAVNRHDFNRFEGFYADSIVWNDPGISRPVKGPRSVGKRLRDLTKAFPDLRWKLDNIFTQGENVCAQFTFTGTHRGALSGSKREKFSASNRPVRIQAVGVYAVRGGKIVSSIIYFDYGNLVSQIQKKKSTARKSTGVKSRKKTSRK